MQGDHKHFSSKNLLSYDSKYFNSNRENRPEKLQQLLCSILYCCLIPNFHSEENIFVCCTTLAQMCTVETSKPS